MNQKARGIHDGRLIHDHLVFALRRQRGADEVATVTGRTADGRIETIRVVSDGSPVANYSFDVTPARLVTGLITERGVLKADRGALARAFSERAGPRPR